MWLSYYLSFLSLASFTFNIVLCNEISEIGTKAVKIAELDPMISIPMYIIEKADLLWKAFTSKACNLNKNECTKYAAKKIFKRILRDSTQDPAYRNKFDGQISDLNYTFIDMYMFGLSWCKVSKSTFDTKEKTNVFIIQCPKFLMVTHYDMSGTIGNVTLQNQKGYLAMTAKRVVITFKSNYEMKMEDNANHVYFTNITTEVNAKGEVKIIRDDISTEVAEGQQCAENFNNDQELAQGLAEQVIEDMVQGLKVDINDYVKSRPINETLSP